MTTDYRLTVHPARGPRALDPNHPRVDTIILNWNGRVHLVECLDSLRATTYPSAHVVVVDQGSQDGSQQAVLEGYPEVTLLALDRNLEFCRGNNVGIDWALADGAEYVFVLNNDTVVGADCLDRLVATAEAHPDLGVISPMSRRYHDAQVVDLGVRITWWQGLLHSIRPEEVPAGTRLLVCDYTWGCAMLIPQRVLAQIHGFNPAWNLYHEDADLCLRARHAGYLTATCLDAEIRHKLGASTGTPGRFLRHFYLRLRNLCRLVMTHAPLRARVVFALLYWPYVVPRQAVIHALALWRLLSRARAQQEAGHDA